MPCCELVHSQEVSCLWMNIFAYPWMDFAWLAKSQSFFYLLYPLAVLETGAHLASKLPLNEHFGAYSRLDFVLSEVHLFFCLLYPLAVLWTGAILEGTYLWSEHVHTYSKLDFTFCMMKIHFFLYLLWLLTVFQTGAPLASKLPVNECVFCVLKIEFCAMSENPFLFLPPLPTCCVVNWCTLSG